MLKNRYQFVAGVVGAILFVVLGATDVRACLCPAMEVKERVELIRKEADAIFAGTVRSVETIKANSSKVVISVERSWIEEDVDEYTIYSSGASPSGCGVSFLKGRSYLVYAKKDKEDRLVTEICWGTRELSLAKEDLKILGNPVATFSQRQEMECPAESVVKVDDYPKESWQFVDLPEFSVYIPRTMSDKNIECYDGSCYVFADDTHRLAVDINAGAFGPGPERGLPTYAERRACIGGRTVLMWYFTQNVFSSPGVKYVSGIRFRFDQTRNLVITLLSESIENEEIASRVFSSIRFKNMSSTLSRSAGVVTAKELTLHFE